MLYSKCSRIVPDDKDFVIPKSYKQPLKSYLKQCGCLVTNRKYLIASHMGPEPPNSFKEVARDQQYGKLTPRHHVFRQYVSPNQTCPVLGVIHKWHNFDNRTVFNPTEGFYHLNQLTF